MAGKPLSITPMERLMRHLDAAEPGECWVWTGSQNGSGYGEVFADGKKRYAHRYAYEKLRGAIPEGLELDHLCRNRACCNPEHLEPVTRGENMRRSPLVGKTRVITQCKRGHPFDEENTYQQADSARFHRRCGACRRARYVEHGT